MLKTGYWKLSTLMTGTYASIIHIPSSSISFWWHKNLLSYSLLAHPTTSLASNVWSALHFLKSYFFITPSQRNTARMHISKRAAQPVNIADLVVSALHPRPSTEACLQEHDVCQQPQPQPHSSKYLMWWADTFCRSLFQSPRTHPANLSCCRNLYSALKIRWVSYK